MFRPHTHLRVFCAVAIIVIYTLLYLEPPKRSTSKQPSCSSELPPVTTPPSAIHWCKPLRWLKENRTPVALISCPGCGSTWLRYLLQQATGIITGSAYTDPDLLANGYPGEGVTNGSVLVVYAHERMNFTRGILLMRDPKDCILAEYNRLWAGPKGFAPQIAFTAKNLTGMFQKKARKYNAYHLDWQEHFQIFLTLWEMLYLSTLKNYRGLLHVIFYDKLVSDTKNMLLDVLKFLNVFVSEKDLLCAVLHKEGPTHRRNELNNFDPFTLEMHTQMEAAKAKVLKLASSEKYNYQKRFLQANNSKDKVLNTLTKLVPRYVY